MRFWQWKELSDEFQRDLRQTLQEVMTPEMSEGLANLAKLYFKWGVPKMRIGAGCVCIFEDK